MCASEFHNHHRDRRRTTICPHWFNWKAFTVALVLIALSMVAATAVWSQESRGTVLGRVTDQTGAVIPNASIQILNQATKQKLTTKSNASGEYSLPLVQPGAYVLTATAPHFSTTTTTITLDISQRLQTDIQLTVGSEATTVEVEAITPLLQTADANVGQVIDQRRIAELPLANGSPYELVYSTPGFSPPASGGTSNSSLTPDGLQGSTPNMVANGMPSGSTEWTIDGIPNTTTTNANQGTGMAISPPTDAVQEFRAEINYDASSGHTSGFIVNSVLKTGGEKFHGSGYMFGRTKAAMANTWLNDNYASGAQKPKADFDYTRYGGSFNGPVRVPRFYDGRRGGSFFAYSAEYMSLTRPNTGTFTVPTAKEATGDFTERLALSANPAGSTNPYTVYDPATIALVGGVYTIQPLQCGGAYNVMCSGRISKAGQAIAKTFPTPNATGANNGTESNFTTNTSNGDVYWANMIRFDQTVNSQQRFYIRTAWAHRITGPYRNFWDSPVVGNNYIGDPKSGVFDYTWTMNESLVMDLRYGYIYNSSGHTPRSVGANLSNLGFSANAISQFSYNGHSGIPFISVEGTGNAYGGMPGQETVGDYRDNNIHSVFVSALKQHNSHSIKVGVDARAYRLNAGALGDLSGYFDFGGNYTGSSTVGGTIPSGGLLGASWASLLLGQPQGGYIDRNTTQADQSTYWGPYVHDSWRISDRLTVDLGLRWEYYGPITERFNRAVGGFLPNATNAVTVAAQAAYAAKPDASLPVSSFKATGGLLFAGQDGRRGFYLGSHGIPAGRFGYALRLRDNIVLRGGSGIFAITNGQDGPSTSVSGGGNAYSFGYSNQTSFVPTLNNGLTFLATLDNPFPNGITPVSSTNAGVNTSLGQTVAFYNPNLESPYAIHWHQGLQFNLPSQTVFELDYQGNKAVKLEMSRSINGLPNQYLTNNPTTPDSSNRAYLNTQISNPLAGLLPGSTLNSPTIARSSLLVPYPQFAGVTELVSQGASWYHSLIVRADRRFANGYTVQASYVWAKMMDVGSNAIGGGQSFFLNPSDQRPERGISTYDRTHHLSITGMMELPVGRGKVLLPNAGSVLNRIVGGWQLGASYQFYTGVPIGFTTNFALSGNIRDAVRSDHPKVSSANGAAIRWFNATPFNTSVSASALQGNLRVNPIYYSFLRTGLTNDLNASLNKSIPIVEGIKATFRFEAFNVMNHPTMWGSPDTNPTSGTFGQVTGGPGMDPRMLQFGGKITF